MRQLEGPLSPTERIYTLDIVRGFALLGILIMNMPGFASSFFAEADGSHLWTARVDQLAEQLRDMLFSGKFNSMFSLLFGIGFTIQSARMHSGTRNMRRTLPAPAAGAAGLGSCTPACSGPATSCTSTPSWASRLLLVLRQSATGHRQRCIAASAVPGGFGPGEAAGDTPEITAELVRSRRRSSSNNAAYGHGTFVDAAREHDASYLLLRQPLSLWANPRLVGNDGPDAADRPPSRAAPLAAAHPRADAADPPLHLVGARHRLACARLSPSSSSSTARPARRRSS